MPSTPFPTPTEEATDAQFLNVAAYKFVKLDNLECLRKEIKTRCLELQLRGTVLLSREGINLFLAGRPADVRLLLDELRAREPFADLEAKESISNKVPFRRMLVRLKKEIIPCGQEKIRPDVQTSPKLPARELKQWLDEGRPVRLLDVRNNYEIELGTFNGAEQLNLGHFRDFTSAIERLPEEAKREPLVMFCTGGIRCEKAGPIMEEAGFQQVYQLDGGILKYFEECGGAHWDGACFVFDGRVALDPQLNPTGNLLCFACQAVLTAEDVTSGKFLFGEYCPRCYQPPKTLHENEFQQRQKRIRELAAAQPGCTPYTNIRDIHVAGRFDGWNLLDFLCQWQPAIGREQWLLWLESGQIQQKSGTRCQANDVVRAGNSLVQFMPETTEPSINPNITLLHEDESLVVIDKPAPLACHPSGRFNRNTLLSILSKAYPHEKLRLCHRLDAWTTGVTLLTRKHRPTRNVLEQFANQSVQKTYLARVHGHPDWEECVCDEPISPHPVDSAGRRSIDDAGQPASTHLRVLYRFPDQTALLEVRPLSGRTNQIRLHLKYLGHCIVGDPLYADETLREKSSSGHSAPHTGCQSGEESPANLCLHAQKLALRHPDSGEPVEFRADNPEWCEGR